jgi:cytoskeleton protein RodZ
MADEQDDDALFDRLAKSLDAVREDAALARSGGAAGVTASVNRVEAELGRLAAAIDGLTERVAAQQRAAAARDAAAAKSAAELQALRQTVEALSRRVQEQDSALAEQPVPRRPRAGLIAIVLAAFILVGGAIAAWLAVGWHPTMGQLTDRFTSRVSELAGFGPPQHPPSAPELAQSAAPAAPVLPPPGPAQVEAAPVTPDPVIAAAPNTPAPPEAPPVQAPPPTATAAPAPTQPASPLPVPPPASVASAPPPAEAPPVQVPPPAATAAAAPTQPANPLPVPPPASVASAPPPAEARPVQAARQVTLRATADAWVEVRQKSGRTLLRKTMKPGETWPVPADPTLLLTSGNASVLELVVGGVTTHLVPARAGMVRDMPLDPQAISAAARSTP